LNAKRSLFFAEWEKYVRSQMKNTSNDWILLQNQVNRQNRQHKNTKKDIGKSFNPHSPSR
jgi:hypothetical protein